MFFFFQRFYAFNCKFLTDFVNWNVEKGQQVKNVLSSRLFEEFIAGLYVKMSPCNTEKKQKSKNVLFFNDFMLFPQIFVGLRGLEHRQRSTRKKRNVQYA